MEDLGLTSDEVHDVFSLVGAVLKLGNLTFVPTTNMDGTEGCVISNDYGKNVSQPFNLFKLQYGPIFLSVLVIISSAKYSIAVS